MLYIRSTLVLAAALAICADAPDLAPFQMPLRSLPDFDSLSAPVWAPRVIVAIVDNPTDQPSELQPQSRLSIIRFVDGEFAKLVEPLPRGKKGFKILAGKPLDDKALQDALRIQGAAANQGETVQITRIEFRSHEIVFEINGGPKKHFHLREHLQISVGGTANPPPPTDSHPSEGKGAMLILDYRRPLPDMSPDDVKHDLSVLLDFSKQHSATVNWVETLPPQFQQAIKDHTAIVGMDHDMVIAALGRPDHKVRERDSNGDETEDWIYGTPPAKTVFVTFSGDKVIRVKEFN
jgi:hypothetical protein